MRKIYLALAAAAAVATASAKVELPKDLNQDFSGFEIPASWSSRGIDAKVGSDYKNYFPNYSTTNAYSVLSGLSDNDGNPLYVAFSPSVFTKGESSNEWLISEEFEITQDEAILCFNVISYMNTAKANFKVLLSEGGTEVEDFTEELVQGTVAVPNTSNYEYFKNIAKRVILSGKKGKKVRVAFVNCDNTSGMQGFTNIQVAPYYVNVKNTNLYEVVKANPAGTNMSVSMTICTPVRCEGVTAVLTTESGFTTTFETDKLIRNSALTVINVEFPDLVKMADNKDMEKYTITITPNYEGAVPLVVSGALINCNYESVALLEEATDTGCGYCPYGYALLNFFQDKYNVDGKQRVIAAAYHDQAFKQDPMCVQSLMTEYKNFAMNKGFTGYPFVMINRFSGDHPAYINIEELLAEKTYGAIKIKSCVYDKDTKNITVRYSAELGYDFEEAGINLVALVNQNNMHGTSSVWAQANYLSSTTSAQIANMFGEDAVPYFELFINNASNPVPASKMYYNDIARSAYPSFRGAPLEGTWKKGVKRNLELTFPLPSTVTNWEEAEVVLILTNEYNGAGGQSITADRMELTDAAAVNGVAADNFALRGDNGAIIVNAEEAGVVTLYAIDGKVLGEFAYNAGTTRINVPEFKGIVLAKSGVRGRTVTSKVVIK